MQDIESFHKVLPKTGPELHRTGTPPRHNILSLFQWITSRRNGGPLRCKFTNLVLTIRVCAGADASGGHRCRCRPDTSSAWEIFDTGPENHRDKVHLDLLLGQPRSKQRRRPPVLPHKKKTSWMSASPCTDCVRITDTVHFLIIVSTESTALRRLSIGGVSVTATHARWCDPGDRAKIPMPASLR
jgi:hypothetical protein